MSPCLPTRGGRQGGGQPRPLEHNTNKRFLQDDNICFVLLIEKLIHSKLRECISVLMRVVQDLEYQNLLPSAGLCGPLEQTGTKKRGSGIKEPMNNSE